MGAKSQSRHYSPMHTHIHHALQVKFKDLFQKGYNGSKNHMANLFPFTYDKYNNLRNICEALKEEKVRKCIRLWYDNLVPGTLAWNRTFPTDKAEALEANKVFSCLEYDFVRTWVTDDKFIFNYWSKFCMQERGVGRVFVGFQTYPSIYRHEGWRSRVECETKQSSVSRRIKCGPSQEGSF